jgi:hypothetical protein
MVGGQQAYTGEGQTVGVNNLSESLQGVHRAFFERGIPVDFLHVRDLGTPRAAGYNLLIAPYPVMMSQPHFKALVEYVRGGGTLLTEARCGWVDEKGASSPVVPGGGLDEVFGCREIELTPLAKTGVVEVKAADEAFPLLKPGDKLDSLFFEESFDVFGKDSRIVAAFRTGGRLSWPRRSGRAGPLCRFFLGSAYHHFKNPNNGKFFAGLADWLKISAPVRVASSVPDAVVEGRLLQGDGYALLFGFNRGDKAVTAKFGVRTDAAKPAAIDLETGQAVPLVRDGGRAVLEKALEPGQAWVARILLK